jgi:hypothetical protein
MTQQNFDAPIGMPVEQKTRAHLPVAARFTGTLSRTARGLPPALEVA